MTVYELSQADGIEILNLASDAQKRKISGIYCCDLLSVVMSKAFLDCAWITIMGNINAAAVAQLTEMSCIVLSEGAAIDELMIEKAKSQDITVLKSLQPIFETALKIHGLNQNA